MKKFFSLTETPAFVYKRVQEGVLISADRLYVGDEQAEIESKAKVSEEDSLEELLVSVQKHIVEELKELQREIHQSPHFSRKMVDMIVEVASESRLSSFEECADLNERICQIQTAWEEHCSGKQNER